MTNRFQIYRLTTAAALAAFVTAFVVEGMCTQTHSSTPAVHGSPHQHFNDIWEKESLFLSDLVESLAPDSGFTPTVVWMGEGWSNMGGGLKRGWRWNSLLTLGFEQDLDKLFKTDGLGTVGMSLLYFTSTGDFAEKNVGVLSQPSNIYTVNGFRFFEIYYTNEFKLSVGTLTLRLGQLAADEDFMCLEYNDIFLNENFGAIPTSSFIESYKGFTVFSQYPLATFGMVVNYELDDWHFRLGFYNGNAGEEKTSNYGFGYKFDSFTLWYELDYHYKIAEREGVVMFGGNFNNGKFAKHNARDDDEEDNTTSRNFYSFYVGVRQNILEDCEGKAILGAFCRLGWAPKTSIAEFTKYFDAGINWFAPIPGRTDDVLALGISAKETASSFRDAESVTRFDTVLETTYKARITKAIYLQPTCQMYFNAVDSKGTRHPAAVFGMRATIHF